MNDKQIAVVTGANGFVGSHLVDLLLRENFTVRCITRKTSDLKWLKGKDVEIYDCGLTNREALSEAFTNASYIFHVAGVVKSKTPEGYFKGNVETTRIMLEAALEQKASIKRFLIVSSQTATGPSLDGKLKTEDDENHPITTYGRSKLAEEELAKTYMDRLPITICRAPAVYGERDTEIFIFFDTFKKGLMTEVGFDKKEVSLIHVADLVRGIYLAAVSQKSAGQIYFIGTEKPATWKEVGDITSRVLNKKAFKVKVPHFLVYVIASVAQFFSMFSSKPATLNLEKARDLVQHAWTCDSTKAARDFGYRQQISLEDGITRTCNWYKQQGWL